MRTERSADPRASAPSVQFVPQHGADRSWLLEVAASNRAGTSAALQYELREVERALLEQFRPPAAHLGEFPGDGAPEARGGPARANHSNPRTASSGGTPEPSPGHDPLSISNLGILHGRSEKPLQAALADLVTLYEFT